MRMLFGIIVGVGLALATAYVHDSSVKAESQQIVNWQTLGTVAQDQTIAIRRLWNETVGRIGKTNEAG